MGNKKYFIKFFFIMGFVSLFWIVRQIQQEIKEYNLYFEPDYFSSYELNKTMRRSQTSIKNSTLSRDKTSFEGQRSTYEINQKHVVTSFEDQTSTYDIVQEHFAYSLPVKDDLVVYNKIGKCGSSSLLAVASSISRRNGYEVYQHILGTERPSKNPPPDVLERELNAIAKLPKPALYARHAFFINFTKYGYEKPIYINMVRDPVERFVSQFYFDQVGSFGMNKSHEGKLLNVNDCILSGDNKCNSVYWNLLITKFFCGNSDVCNNPDDAIEMAKEHIRNEYTFIGITEEFDNSLKLLEIILPKYFKNAASEWENIRSYRLHRFTTVEKEEISPQARKILAKRFTKDYEIYRVVKKKFEKLKQRHGIV